MAHQPAPPSLALPDDGSVRAQLELECLQGEFFSADLPQRFVRESVQNSLVARAGREPVVVRFTISGLGVAVSRSVEGVA